MVKPSPQTLNAFMAEWFKAHAQRHCSPKTVERYQEQAAYFLPSLGHVKLADLNGLTIEREMNRLKDAGGHHRKTKAKRPLSAKSVCNIAGVLNAALGTAVRWKLIKSNPMAAVQLPKVEKIEAVALDADKTEWFLAAARGHYLHPILCLAVATGCRRGELLALQWTDVITAARSIIVSKSLEQTRAGLRIKCPKGGNARTFPLPAVAIEALEIHRQRQAEHRRLYAADYRTDLNLIFATPEGDYLKPDTTPTRSRKTSKPPPISGMPVTAAACLLAKRAVNLRRDVGGCVAQSLAHRGQRDTSREQLSVLREWGCIRFATRTAPR